MQTLEELEAIVAAKRNKVNELRDIAEKREYQKRMDARTFLASGRQISVFMLVDPAAGCDRTTDDEYDSIERTFCETFKNEFKFQRDVYPHRLEGENPDIYLLDFGGMLGVGCDGATHSVFRSLRQQIEDHPNTIFILWSEFTNRFYKDLMVKEYQDMNGDMIQHNVVFARDHELQSVLTQRI